MFSVHQRALAGIRTHHRNHPTCIENDLCRFWISKDVRFCGTIDVPSCDRSAHDDDIFHQTDDGWVFRNGQSNIRQWADRNQRDFMWILVNQLNDEIGGKPGIYFVL